MLREVLRGRCYSFPMIGYKLQISLKLPVKQLLGLTRMKIHLLFQKQNKMKKMPRNKRNRMRKVLLQYLSEEIQMGKLSLAQKYKQQGGNVHDVSCTSVQTHFHLSATAAVFLPQKPVATGGERSSMDTMRTHLNVEGKDSSTL